MATQQQNKGGGQQKQPPKCPLCPAGQQKLAPEGRWGCAEHQPMVKVAAELVRAIGGAPPWQLIVRTAKNGEATGLPVTIVSPATGEKFHLKAKSLAGGFKEVSLAKFEAAREVIVSLDDDPQQFCRLTVPAGDNFPIVREIKAVLYRNPRKTKSTVDNKDSSAEDETFWLAAVTTSVNGALQNLGFNIMDIKLRGIPVDEGQFKDGFLEVPLSKAGVKRTAVFVLQGNPAIRCELEVPAGDDSPGEPKPVKDCRLTAQSSGEVGKSGEFHILIQTYELEPEGKKRQTNIPFIIECFGQEVELVDAGQPGFKNGVYSVKIEMKVGKEQKVRFHIVGCEADTAEIIVPALQCRRGPGVDPNADWKENFLRGLGLREDKKEDKEGDKK